MGELDSNIDEKDRSIRFIPPRGGYLVVGSALGDWPIYDGPEPSLGELSGNGVSPDEVLDIIARIQSDPRTPEERFKEIGDLVTQIEAERSAAG